MYRLTDRFDDGTIGIKDCLDSTQLVDILSEINGDVNAGSAMDALERLSDYEDTGETPESIKNLLGIARDQSNFIINSGLGNTKKELDYWKTEAKKAMAQLGEIKIAEEQGLLVKLPCKVGDKTYIVFNDMGELFITEGWYLSEITITENDVIYEFDCYKTGDHESRNLNSFGKTVFLTREAAEEALKGGASK